MSNAPQIAEVAALVGDPARANMLCALLGGRALTATELAFAAGVSPQTTSGHLGKLFAARLVVVMKQGRHRYYRLAGPQIGQMLESIMNVALTGPPRFQPRSKLDDRLRHARTCYDHIAGVLGVALAERLRILHPRRGGRRSDAVRHGFFGQSRRRFVRRERQTPGVLPSVPRLDRTPAAYRRGRRRGAGPTLLRAEMDRADARQPRLDRYPGRAPQPARTLLALDLANSFFPAAVLRL